MTMGQLMELIQVVAKLDFTLRRRPAPLLRLPDISRWELLMCGAMPRIILQQGAGEDGCFKRFLVLPSERR